MQEALERLDRADLLRRAVEVASPCGPRMTVEGRQVTCLCSNDYLSLAGDPAVRAVAVAAIEKWGVGAGASRLISGTTGLHVQLERRLAEFKGTPSAVVTSTGWMANRVAVGALAGPGDLILCDKLSHASIIDAALCSGARTRTFAHGNTARLEALLRRHRARARRCLIATDSLFSMDGDLAPLGELVELKKRYDSQLLIDEAHATGVLGRMGRGAAELLGVEGDIDATAGTLSKALGALGGFVAGPEVLVETIRNTGSAFIYTTAPPALLCAAVLAGLDIVADQPHRRKHVLELAEQLRVRLHAVGLKTGKSISQIVPVMIGPAAEALRVSRELFDRGLFVPAIRPPTVPRGTSRLRVSLCAGHTGDDVAKLADALSEIVA